LQQQLQQQQPDSINEVATDPQLKPRVLTLWQSGFERGITADPAPNEPRASGGETAAATSLRFPEITPATPRSRDRQRHLEHLLASKSSAEQRAWGQDVYTGPERLEDYEQEMADEDGESGEAGTLVAVNGEDSSDVEHYWEERQMQVRAPSPAVAVCPFV
jgi:hypothetical protein